MTRIFILIISLLLFSCSGKSNFDFSISDNYSDKITEKSSGEFKFYKFCGIQNEQIKEFHEFYGDSALKIIFNAKKVYKDSDNPIVQFGFLYSDDFSNLGNISSRPLVSIDFKKIEGRSISVVFCVEKDRELPKGFFVKNLSKNEITGCQVVRAQVGFDYSSENHLFAFAPNGGIVQDESFQADLSGASLAFSSKNTREGLMPKVVINFSDTVAGQNKISNTDMVRVNFGGERLNIIKSGNQIEVPLSSLKSPFSHLSITENTEYVLSAMLSASDKKLLSFAMNSKNVTVPIKVDPGLIISWPKNNWRGNDYELFEWDRFPGILLFDTISYSVQDDFFRRLAFFVEKAGYRGRLLSDAELGSMHGYNAHDYSAESLALFFETARETGFQLNEKENLLKQILAENGVIQIMSDGKVISGHGAIISISQETVERTRISLLAHEGWHGLFFTDDDFRNTAASIYYTIDRATLDYLLKYFQITPTLNYDTNDDFLMKNEFMAYMLQNSLSQCGHYFVSMAKRSHSQYAAKKEADYIIQTNGEGFVGAATLFDEYVSDRWNLAAGRIWLICH